MQSENSLPIQWRVPVRIRFGRGIADAVRGPEEALHHLTYRWPATDGPHYDNARRQCLQALQKRVAAEVVRETFLAARLEAGMLER
ncbi:DUF982 domain-containing protein [Rhizobium sp. B230/85]|uniref:DUF982 domain-containing protein n=1 Tax=unclassified Rhizobium TaxID=2613769 RepID=UPI001ADC8993|nr:DUF982 domain-containing protein [Rhizobium sp. B209b/85]QXZ98553.1 DUF982 domain-containing protein [Rhizobium sp. B230/85]